MDKTHDPIIPEARRTVEPGAEGSPGTRRDAGTSLTAKALLLRIGASQRGGSDPRDGVSFVGPRADLVRAGAEKREVGA